MRFLGDFEGICRNFLRFSGFGNLENLEFGNIWGDLREFKGKFWAHLERPRIWGRVWHHLRGGKKIKKK